MAQRLDPYGRYRALLSGGEVRSLSQLRPLRVIVDAALCWALIFLAWACAVAIPHPLLIALSCLLVGNRVYALFILGHDGLHWRLFKEKRLNDMFCDLFIFGPIGSSVGSYRRNHLLHHRHLATDEDPDRPFHCCSGKDTSTLLGLHLSGLGPLLRTLRRTIVEEKGEDATVGGQRGAILIALTCQAFLALSLTTKLGWWGYPCLWLMPVYLFTYVPNTVRSFAEHSHPEADALADQHRLITYLAPWWERQFFAPFNMNCHAAHHLWPSIPYYNLPKADRLLRERCTSDDLEWRNSYVGYLLRYYAKLPLTECRIS